jgi:hypothetical protein
MIVDDLKFVEDVTTESIEGAGGSYYPPTYPCYYPPASPYCPTPTYSSNVKTRLNLQGNLAEIWFDNSAFGKNTVANSELSNTTIAGKGSFQSGSLLAASTGGKGGGYGGKGCYSYC